MIKVIKRNLLLLLTLFIFIVGQLLAQKDSINPGHHNPVQYPAPMKFMVQYYYNVSPMTASSMKQNVTLMIMFMFPKNHRNNNNGV